MNEQANYYLATANTTYLLRSFISAGHTFSNDYCYHLWLAKPIEANDLLGQAAKLICQRQDSRNKTITQSIEGVLTDQIDHDQLLLRSPLALMKLVIKNRTFVQQSVLQIIAILIAECQQLPIQFKIITQKHYPILDWVCQDQQSNYDFFCQQCAEHDLTFVFVGNNDQHVLIITDDPQHSLLKYCRQHQLAYQQVAGMIPASPSISALHIKQQYYADQIRVIKVTTDAIGINVGDRVTIANYPLTKINKTYVVRAIQPSTQPAYVNQLVLVADKFIYDKVKIHKPVNNYQYAMIDSESSSKQPYLNTFGHYRLRLNFDEAQHPAGKASSWVAVMQTYIGQNYGWHFPLKRGAKVLLNYLEDLHTMPVIQGVIREANHLQQIIIAASSKQGLIFNTKKSNAAINLHNQYNKQVISLQDNNNTKTITIIARQGNINLAIGKSLKIHCQANLAMTAKHHYHVTVKRNAYLHTTKGSCQFSTAKYFMQTSTDSIIIQANHYLYWRAAQDIKLTTKDTFINISAGNCYFISNKDINLSSQNLVAKLTDPQGVLTISQGAGRIKISRNGQIRVQAPSITFQAQTVKLHALRQLSII